MINEPITNNHLLARLNWRYATRKFDPTRKISESDWSALEEALVLSPSSGGLQPWRFVVIEDLEVRSVLQTASYGQPQITTSSHLVVFAVKTNFGVADVDEHISRMGEVRRTSVGALQPFRNSLVGGVVEGRSNAERQEWATRQAYIALGVLLTFAAAVGVDACPMEGFSPNDYDEILGLEAHGLTSVVICALGYRSSSDSYASEAKVRFPHDRVILRL